MPMKLGIRRKKSNSSLGAKSKGADLGLPSNHSEDHDVDVLAPLIVCQPQTFDSTKSETPEIHQPSTGTSSVNKNSLQPSAVSETQGKSNSPSPDRSTRPASSINMTPPALEEEVPLLTSKGLRKRRSSMPRYVPTDWDDSLPYGGKVYLARRKKPDSWPCIAIQVLLILFSVGLMYYGWYHTDHLHFHATKLYGHYGHPIAQAMTAEKYLNGKGVEKNYSLAMEWYKKAAKQGHPHSSYNLAVGHLQGMDVGLKPGEAHALIKHAAKNGVVEAADVLDKVCSKGRCDE